MAGNTEIIDTVVDPAVHTQFEALKKDLETADAMFIETAKSASALNTILLNTKSFKDFNKAVNDSAVANEKLQQAQNKTSQSSVNLQKSQLALTTAQDRAQKQSERAAEAAKKLLSPYAQLSRELDKQRIAAKDLGVQYGLTSPQFRQAAKGVQEMDAQVKAIDYTLGQSQRNVGNYAGAFHEVLSAYIPFGEGTLKVSENLKKLTEGLGEGKTELGALGAGFLDFTAGSFLVAIAAASYYLSQFKSTGHEVEKFLSGLKSQFAQIGESAVEGVKKFSFKKLLSPSNAIRGLLGVDKDTAHEAGKGFAESFQKGVEEKADEIELGNLTELSENTIAANSAEIQSLRALAADKKTDIVQRAAYIKRAQELAKESLKDQQDNAQATINLGIRTGDRFGKLTFDQAQALSKGDLALAQGLSEQGQLFTSAGYEIYKKGIDKKIQAQASSAALQLQLQADADNMQLKADRALSIAQERLDKAKVQSALDNAKSVLEDDKAGYAEKIRANQEFIDNSLKLLKIQRQHELDAAGIPAKAGADSRTEAKNRQAIEVETQNAIKKVQNEGAANLRKIIKDNNDLYAKDAEERLKLAIGIEKQLENVYINSQNKRLQDIESFRSQQERSLAQQYATGAISQQAYNQQLYEIDAKASEERLQLQIDTLKKIAEAQASALARGFGDPKELQATGEKINNLVIQQDNLKTQHLIKNADELARRRKEVADVEKQLVTESLTFIQTLVDASFQNQLNHIKDLQTATDEQAKSEKDAVNGSIQSQAEKGRKNALIDARAAQQKANLDAQARRIQQKQAEFDRIFSLAKIAQNTAIGVTSALAEYPPNIPLAILVGALGAVEIATVLATPIPKFAEGGTTAGGNILWGEAGIERAETPAGQVSYSPDHATVTAFPKGTKITPNYELQRLVKPEKYNYQISRDDERLRELISATKANKPERPKPQRTGGWMREVGKADSWARYSQNYFK